VAAYYVLRGSLIQSKQLVGYWWLFVMY